VDIAHAGTEIRNRQSPLIEDVGIASAAHRLGLDHASGTACRLDHLAHERRVVGNVHCLVFGLCGVFERRVDAFALNRDGRAGNGLRKAADHVRHLSGKFGRIARARFAAHYDLVGNDIHRAAALDQAQVRRGLFVNSAKLHP
jgi:hypothetical protein